MADYLIILFFATVQLAWWLRRVFSTLPDARRAARMAIGVYVGLLISGSVLLALVK
jgi:hypothetical protein